jgi:hypothetical protein
LRRTISLPLAGVAIVISLYCLAGCAVALAPGFQIEKETRQIHFIAGEMPALMIHVEFALVNTGTGELKYVNVRLPTDSGAGLTGLRVRVDGQDVDVTPVSEPQQQAQSRIVRITFKGPWQRRRKREIDFDYALRPSNESQSYVTVQPDDFHLGVRGWAPQLQPPKYILSTYPSRPPHGVYTIRVPASFALLAGGARKGQKKIGDEMEYRFASNEADLGAFVVAGSYTKWPPSEKQSAAAFWTAKPLSGNPSQSAQEIAKIWKTLEETFGTFDKGIRGPVIAESAAVKYDVAGTAGPAAVSYPGGALVNPAAFALGIESDQFLQIVSQALARNWFDEEVLPNSEATIGMGDGLPEYAEIVANEARNGPLGRRQRIYEYLRKYDAAAKFAAETPIAATTSESPLLQRRIALAKAPLFYIELEDACGEAPVRAGLAHMLSSMRGQEVDYNILRSALEESSGRDLGKIFREWLHQKGIPANFRVRYHYGEGAEQMGN